MHIAYNILIVVALLVALVFSVLVLITGKGDAMSGGSSGVRTTFKGKANFDDIMSQWTLSFDGKSISLHPSVGNWNFPCRSHYWIRNNQVLWAKQWTKAQIAAGQHLDAKAVRDEFAAVHPPAKKAGGREKVESSSPRKGLLAKFKSIFGK